MQAITTRFIGPTNTRGSRVKATAEAGSVTLSWDHSVISDENHAAAAKALVEKLDWGGQWYAGGLLGADNVFVCVTDWRGDINTPTFDCGLPDRHLTRRLNAASQVA